MNIGYIALVVFGGLAVLVGLLMILARKRFAKNMQGVRGYEGITSTGVVAFGAVTLFTGLTILILLVSGVIVPRG